MARGLFKTASNTLLIQADDEVIAMYSNGMYEPIHPHELYRVPDDVRFVTSRDTQVTIIEEADKWPVKVAQAKS